MKDVTKMKNVVFATGRLKADAETGVTANKKVPYAKFTLVSDKRYVKKTETDPPAPNFYPIEVYGGKVGEYETFLKKGHPVAIVGSIRTESYEGKDGQRKHSWKIVADEVAELPEGAMTGMSSVSFIGELQKDATVRYVPKKNSNGEQAVITDMFVKVGRQNGGNDFVPVTLFGRLGELLGRYLVAEKSVTVIGKLETGSYKNSEGTIVYTWNVVADNLSPNGSGKAAASMTETMKETPAPQPSIEEEAADEFSDTGFVELPAGFDDEYFED